VMGFGEGSLPEINLFPPDWAGPLWVPTRRARNERLGGIAPGTHTQRVPGAKSLAWPATA
jgi:hypothetical protein